MKTLIYILALALAFYLGRKSATPKDYQPRPVVKIHRDKGYGMATWKRLILAMRVANLVKWVTVRRSA